MYKQNASSHAKNGCLDILAKQRQMSSHQHQISFLKRKVIQLCLHGLYEEAIDLAAQVYSLTKHLDFVQNLKNSSVPKYPTLCIRLNNLSLLKKLGKHWGLLL